MIPIINPVYVTDVIQEVVTATKNLIVAPGKTLLQYIKEKEAAALGESLIEDLRYSKSSFDELIETLVQADKDGKGEEMKKYPLIHLIRDFDEVHDGGFINCSLDFIIIHQTESTYKIDDRDEKVFKPVLVPIREAFIHCLLKHKQVVSPLNKATLKVRETKHAFWGNRQLKGSKNTLVDYVDAIGLYETKLKFDLKPC